MRWEQSLEFYCITRGNPVSAAVRDLAFEVSIKNDDCVIAVHFSINGCQLNEPDEVSEWWNQDHALICIDPDHDHMNCYMIRILPDGELIIESRLVMPGEERSDRIGRPDVLPPLDCSVETQVNSDGWSGVLQISREQITGSVFGFSAKAISGGMPLIAVVIPENQPEWSADTPMGYADVILDGDTVPIAIDFGQPEWKLNSGFITFQEALTDNIKTSAVFNYLEGTCKHDSILNTDNNRFEYELDFRGKWTNNVLDTSYIDLTIGENWQARYPVGFDCGIIARDRTGGTAIARPKPAEPDFLPAYRDYLLTNLPVSKRTSTRDGAPDDYCMQLDDVHVSLSQPDTFDVLARIIAERFPDWTDGLCAASVLLGASAGVPHSATCARFGAALSPQGMLQLGAGFCGQESAVYGLLAEALGPLYEKPIKAWSLGLRGHIVCVLEIDNAWYPFDPMLGIYFLTADNTRLATLDELRQDKELSHRMDASSYAHGHEFYYGIPRHIISEIDRGGRQLP